MQNYSIHTSRPFVRVALLLGVILFAFASLAAAQTTSTIRGRVIDKQGGVVTGAQVQVTSKDLAFDRTVVSDASGEFIIPALVAGTYTVTVTKEGFRKQVVNSLEVTLNRTLNIDVQLEVGGSTETIQVSGEVPLLETQTSSSSTTITPREISDIPLNGRNYLDLMQLVPGVLISKQNDPGTGTNSGTADTATNVLGERGNNTNYLIDGLPNVNQVNGGPAAQFTQDTIAEFQVITSGYEAEFGHASGGVVNVITKSGTNDIHGLASAFYRSSAFDSSDTSLDVPALLRWDYTAALGGPIIKDKFFGYASGEGIHENRELNYLIPGGTPQVIIDQEAQYNSPSTDREARAFGRFDEILGRHHISEEYNYTNAHIGNYLPLSQYTALPSNRQNYGARSSLYGANDTATLGSSSSPWILNLRGGYREDKVGQESAHPEAGPYTLYNVFQTIDSGQLFGNPQVTFGSITSPSNLDQKYAFLGANIAKIMGPHTLKFGWDYQYTHVDGVEANLQENQLFATISDYEQFGPIDSGFFLLETVGGETPQANQIHLRNNYNGIYAMDDWKILKNLTVNLGLRWDYDSKFNDKTEFSPRLGFAWSINSKTVLRGSWGLFYDQFRLGIARDVPGFGGADLRSIQPLSYPRLFFGVPTIAPALFGLCLSPTLTDAQIAQQGLSCPFPFFPGSPLYGVDHLNNIVAPGHAPIPSNAVVNEGNIQQLSGLDPTTYLNDASLAIGQQPGYLFWGPFGALSYLISPAGQYPVTIDPSFKTPYTNGMNIGLQRQVSTDFMVAVDYYHKNINDILGIRQTNLPFEDRIANNFTGAYVNGFGPWYSGLYDAGILSFEKRMSHRFAMGGSYTLSSERDDAMCSSLDSSLTGVCWPTDSFVGVPGVVSDPPVYNTQGQLVCPGHPSNANAGFFACNGNWVPQAGKFYNGPHLDQGPSDFSIRHNFQMHALIDLPWKIELSTIFRAQSGYHYTEQAAQPLDQDGNGNYGPRNLQTGRNQFVSPNFVNMDFRITKTFPIGDRLQVQGMFEFFNLFNNANPAAMNLQQNDLFGTVAQYLPGREGQFGLRIIF
ncbi:MAG TPA: TonB-dependent receptor [Terriglobales bacterium]|nr:TonB-dependent receptor [Terriglobales bacterium]